LFGVQLFSKSVPEIATINSPDFCLNNNEICNRELIVYKLLWLSDGCSKMIQVIILGYGWWLAYGSVL